MANVRFEIETIRKSIRRGNVLLCWGFFTGTEAPVEQLCGCLEVLADGHLTGADISVLDSLAVQRYYAGKGISAEKRVLVRAELPDKFSIVNLVLRIPVGDQPDEILLKSVSAEDWRKMPFRPLQCVLDSMKETETGYRLQGWTVSREPVEIHLKDGKGITLSCLSERAYRPDVLLSFPELPEGESCGFILQLSQKNIIYPLRIEVQGEHDSLVYKISKKQAEHLLSGMNGGILGTAEELLHRGVEMIRSQGVSAFLHRAKDQLTGKRSITPYQTWIDTCEKRPEPDPEDTRTIIDITGEADYRYRCSVILHVDQPDPVYWKKLVKSLEAQTGRNWELKCSGEPNQVYAAEDWFQDHMSNRYQLQIGACTGEIVLLLQTKMLLSPDAVAAVSGAFRKNPELGALYSDHDFMDFRTDQRSDPVFKPDFSPEYLCSTNYIGQMLAVRKDIYDSFRKQTDPPRQTPLDQSFASVPADEGMLYGQIFSYTEKTEKIGHLPFILYHLEKEEPEKKKKQAQEDNEELQRRDRNRKEMQAVQSYYRAVRLPGEVRSTEKPGVFHTVWHWAGKPVISILVPNKDHAEDLVKCVRSIEEKSLYRHFEILVLENNSVEDRTFSTYEKLEEQYKNLHVLTYKDVFNFSKINNFGAEHASGEYLLLLNNDTELISPHALEDMLGYCRIPGVGAVGGKLYYEDGTIQHCGVIVGYGGFAGHCFIGEPGSIAGYGNRVISAVDYSAVTGACLMTPAAVYRETGGMDEQFVVALNDVDYCLRVRETGRRVVYDPAAEFVHYESRSRGLDEGNVDREKRLQGEVSRFRSRWKELLDRGDPYYNPNLSLIEQDFSLRHL